MSAPTIIAKLVGYRLLGLNAAYQYAALEKGQGLLLIREPDNPVDSQAILCEAVCHKCGGHSAGYIDRNNAALLSPWIDNGWLYVGEVVRGPAISKYGGFIKLDPVPEVEVKCTPIAPLQVKKKRKIHAPV